MAFTQENKHMKTKLCGMCEEQTKKSRNSKPHDYMSRIDECRIFKGRSERGFEEQDYQCQACHSKMTHSTNKNDLAWTLWQG